MTTSISAYLRRPRLNLQEGSANPIQNTSIPNMDAAEEWAKREPASWHWKAHGISAQPSPIHSETDSTTGSARRPSATPIAPSIRCLHQSWALSLPLPTSLFPLFGFLRMDATGTVVRSSFMEIAQAESFYGTPRNFLYQMNRLSDERWSQEQGQDDPEEKPFILTDAEPFIPPGGLSALLENERGFRYDRHRLNDLQVCKLIDRMLSGRSIYQLSSADRNRLANTLYKDHHLSKRQIIRCLALDWTRK